MSGRCGGGGGLWGWGVGGWGGGVVWNPLPTFDPESKSPKIQNSLGHVRGGGWRGGVWNPLPTFDPKSKQIQNSCVSGGGGGGVQNQLLTFDPKSKSAKIQNSLCQWEEGGRVQNQPLSIPSLNLLKSKIPYVRGWGWGSGTNFQLFDPESKSAKI